MALSSVVAKLITVETWTTPPHWLYQAGTLMAGAAVGYLVGLVPSDGATVVHSILGRKTAEVAVGWLKVLPFLSFPGPLPHLLCHRRA